MQRKIAAVHLRGGTSKGLFFHDKDLPSDPKIRDRAILAVFGSPDPSRRQVDGMGGGISSTNKLAIISPALNPAFDVNYYFGQVNIDVPLIDYRGNCGNLSSAVGPFAVDEGLVKAVEPVTRVRILQVNTQKRIVAEIPVKDGKFEDAGTFRIDGVPTAGSKIALHFFDPGGSVTGKLLPTGNVADTIQIPELGALTVSIVDASNPVVFIRAKDVGLEGTEIAEIDADPAIRSRLEAIRCRAAVVLGFAKNPEEASTRSKAFPKIAFVSPSRPYATVNGVSLDGKEMDFVSRAMSLGDLHKAYPVTGSICAAVASRVEGTVVNELLSGKDLTETVRLGHPGGVIELGVRVARGTGGYTCERATVYRTARRIMEGHVLVPETCFGISDR